MTSFAQETEYIPYHYPEFNSLNHRNTMQQRDGEAVLSLLVGIRDDETVHYKGYILYKVQPSTLTITDTLFVEDTLAPIYLFARDPRGEGNIRVNIEPDASNTNTLLRISHFADGDLSVDQAEDVVVPFCEGRAIEDYPDCSLVDSRGDLILRYYKEYPGNVFECHMARYSPEGVLKHEAILPEGQNLTQRVCVLGDSPLQYYHWKILYNNLAIYTLDSLFQTQNTLIVNKVLFEDVQNNIEESFRFNNSSGTHVVIEGNDVFLAARYCRTEDTSEEWGIAVARYDLRTGQLKRLAHFNDWPGQYSDAFCLGFQRMSDGALYLLYKENHSSTVKDLTVVKMDSDLNEEWRRVCSSTKIDPIQPKHSFATVDSEGKKMGMLAIGYSVDMLTNQMGFLLFSVTHDGTIGTNDSGMEVRPYCFCPNPARDRLRFQYSPDVQPKQVELHDLQGRQVHTQNGNFESIDLSHLPAGVYTLRVTMEDGSVYSDKIVKE